MAEPILTLLERRFATRSISPEPLARAWLEKLAEAARLAPSCYNKQPWRLVFLTTPEGLALGRELLSEGNRPWAERAPALVVAHSSEKNDCLLPDGRAYHQFDLGLAVMNLMLAATELGLVARPMAGFDPALARERLGLGPEDAPLVMLALGLPAEDEEHLPAHFRGGAARPRERKPLDEIASFR
jgi:nitroreductase